MLYLIASYPKSGNTMVRIFLAHYLRGSVNLDHVGWPLYGSDHYFPFGLGPDRRKSSPVCRAPLCFAKTHETADQFGPPAAEKVLYLVRNPLDVAPSWANHMMCTIDQAVKSMGKPTRLRPMEHVFAQDIGSWSDNVHGWIYKAQIPVRAVKYETLVSDPGRAFKIILDWFELPFDRARFDEALAFVRFDNLATMEEKKGFRESRGAQGFFRRGKAGEWPNDLTVAQARQILADHHPMMKRLGYAD